MRSRRDEQVGPDAPDLALESPGATAEVSDIGTVVPDRKVCEKG